MEELNKRISDRKFKTVVDRTKNELINEMSIRRNEGVAGKGMDGESKHKKARDSLSKTRLLESEANLGTEN